MRWSSLQNGELLSRAASEFDVFITIDQWIDHQQVLPPGLSMITLKARRNDINSVRPLVPQLLDLLGTIRPGQSVRVSPQ
jgi:hypothetical protein